MNRQYESMTRVHFAGSVVRVWCTEQELRMGPNALVLQQLRALSASASVMAISQALDVLPMVSAYEILDLDGHGGIVYPDWK